MIMKDLSLVTNTLKLYASETWLPQGKIPAATTALKSVPCLEPVAH